MRYVLLLEKVKSNDFDLIDIVAIFLLITCSLIVYFIHFASPYEYIIFGTSICILLYFLAKRREVLTLLYHWFSTSSIYCVFMRNKEGKKEGYLPLLSLSDHAFWIKQNLEKYEKNAIVFVPLNAEIDKDIRLNYIELYRFYHSFHRKVKIVLFFLVTFFLLYGIYSMIIFMMLNFFIGNEPEDQKKLSTLIVFIFFLTFLYAFFILFYVKSFQFKFLDESLMRINNLDGDPDSYYVYLYHNGKVQHYPVKTSEIVEKVEEIRTYFMDIISSILQIATPIFYLVHIQIFIAFYYNRGCS